LLQVRAEMATTESFTSFDKCWSGDDLDPPLPYIEHISLHTIILQVDNFKNIFYFSQPQYHNNFQNKYEFFKSGEDI